MKKKTVKLTCTHTQQQQLHLQNVVKRDTTNNRQQCNRRQFYNDMYLIGQRIFCLRRVKKCRREGELQRHQWKEN